MRNSGEKIESRFERVARCPEAQLPIRSTEKSAGYDLFCAETTAIPPYGIALVSTGVKCYLHDDEWLLIALRSSTPRKKHLMLANGIGIIEPDYADNPDNEGEIFAQVYNFTGIQVLIEKGERIAQAVVQPRIMLDRDNTTGDERIGGFGSTN